MKHVKNFSWLEFLLDIPSLSADLKGLDAACDGIVAADSGSFTVQFEGAPSEELLEAIKAHLESLTEEGEAAKRALPSRKSGKVLSDYIEAKKQAASLKDWNALSAAERKLVMGAALTLAEIDSL